MFKVLAAAALTLSLGTSLASAATTDHDSTIKLKSESIQKNIRVVEDKNLPESVEIVLQEGSDGERTFFKSFREMPTETGAFKDIPVFHDEVTREPVEKVVRKGTNKSVIEGVSDKTIQIEKDKAERKAQEEAEEKKRILEEEKSKTLAKASATESTLADFTGGGSKEDWMREAGIDESDWGYVDYIVNKESTWSINAVNPSSGATGLCQALPGSKMASAGGDWLTNPVTQLKWCDSYAKQRYGSWANSYNEWLSKHWW